MHCRTSSRPERVTRLARKQCMPPRRTKRRLQARRGTRFPDRAARTGFSLLEIILALAILGGAMVVLGEVVRNGMENARIARDLTDAQLFCESKMAELQAGFLTTDAVSDMPIEPMADSILESDTDSSEIEWLYSIDSEVIDDQGLVQVYVSVYQDPATVKKPVTFTITRMILDESMITTETTEDTL